MGFAQRGEGPATVPLEGLVAQVLAQQRRAPAKPRLLFALGFGLLGVRPGLEPLTPGSLRLGSLRSLELLGDRLRYRARARARDWDRGPQPSLGFGEVMEGAQLHLGCDRPHVAGDQFEVRLDEQRDLVVIAAGVDPAAQDDVDLVGRRRHLAGVEQHRSVSASVEREIDGAEDLPSAALVRHRLVADEDVPVDDSNFAAK
jgi:hypothetical protein